MQYLAAYAAISYSTPISNKKNSVFSTNTKNVNKNTKKFKKYP